MSIFRSGVYTVKKASGNIKAWFMLSLSSAFMVFLFAPIEAFYSNKSEFWFSASQLVTVALAVFIIVFIVFIGVSLCLNRMGGAEYFYAVLCFGYLYLYIQGNYIPRNYGVLNGVEINWSEYSNYGIASVAVAILCLAMCVCVILKFKKYIFKIGTYLCVGVLLIQIFTIATLMFQDVMVFSHNKNDSKVVTNKKMLELSAEQNIIVFVLDTFDGNYLNYLLDEDYDTYSDVFQNFTYYKDTLGAYPTTKAALPQILTGVWYENEQPWSDYVSNAYVNNNIYTNIKDYSTGIYTSAIYLSSDLSIYENVEQGNYEIDNLPKFIKTLYRMVAFNYSPHQLKRYFFFDTDGFSDLKKAANNCEAYTADVQNFAYKLEKAGIKASETQKCFRLYHLDGVHAPYSFGKDLVSNGDTEYNAYDEARGNCMLLRKYFDELRKNGIYDNTTIVVMADHGYIGYAQNPIFLVKNIGEEHDFKVSDIEMSYEYLPDIWMALINGSMVDESFINNCRGTKEYRKFLYYSWDDLWDRTYLPLMNEMMADGIASDKTNLFYSGIQYEPKSEERIYSLGTELSFAGQEKTANYYCVGGFSEPEEWGTWTNGKQAIMEFNIKEKNYHNLMLTLECGNYYSGQNVGLYVNDQKVADLYFDKQEKQSVIIPNEYVVDGIVRVTMQLPDAISPNSIDKKNNDERVLALAMHSIKLESTKKKVDLYSQTRGYYALGTTLTFLKADNSAADYYVSGFSHAEDAFTWTDGKTAEMEFMIMDAGSEGLVLEYESTPFNGKQHIILYANDQIIAEYDATAEEIKEIFIAADSLIEGRLHLRFELPNAISPKELGMSEDARTLGLAMKNLVIKSAE